MTTYRLIAPAAVDADVESAFHWYEAQRSGLGLEFLHELRATYTRIADGPYKYQDIRAGTRRALVRRFPFAVYFAIDEDTVDEDTVVALAVIHASRHPSHWQDRQG